MQFLLRNRLHLSTLLAILILAAGCGSDASNEPLAVVERLVEEQLSILGAMADDFEGVGNSDNANVLAARIESEYTPQLMHTARSFAALRASMTQAESDEFIVAVEEMYQSRNEEAIEIGARIDEAVNHILEQPDLATPAFEGALLALVEAMQQIESAMNFALEPSGSGPEALPAGSAVGSPAWCREMASKPESEWSLDDAFAFAGNCTGR
jgi:hypothetical protein